MIPVLCVIPNISIVTHWLISPAIGDSLGLLRVVAHAEDLELGKDSVKGVVC